MTKIVIKQIKREEYEIALRLVRKVFNEFEAPDYSQEGVDEFYKSINDNDYLNNLSMFCAYLNGEIVGVIATRSEGSHIALFFVNDKYQKMGIGRQLFEEVKKVCSSKTMTVNSSPFAVPIYKRLGFVPKDTEQTVCGVRFTPMELVF